ncbi:helix-turn-helix domain-containing protein [Flavobacterium microcysteis]
MIKLNLKPIFKMKGITKPVKYLMEKGHSGSYANSVVNDRILSIPFRKLEQFCIDFNCTPNDLFDFIPENDQKLADDHALYSISKGDAIGEIHKLLNELPVSKIQELYGILKNNQ